LFLLDQNDYVVKKQVVKTFHTQPHNKNTQILLRLKLTSFNFSLKGEKKIILNNVEIMCISGY